ncbi:MAG: PIG-L family deacetylase [Rhodobacteraceae bacterium]|uniref:PIG-L deacetylase family protein n=1 Tax=Salipiger thiooxidans TaxID=282683 RepID=UPI001A8CBC86|nr:PIG-L deacetylase family protein [Salipiger thiooxidans]MBN8189761.1 PIG-L family deacetylase [Salipiger thiooxidans]MBR9840529.1 PIG-L family deacetylase [Paracoccaceae bacterium]
MEFTHIMTEAARAPAIALDELAGPGDILVLAPHPDDESLAMGGAIVAASQTGRRVQVAVLTDGGRSHPNSATHPPRVLSALRRREVETAVRILTGGRASPIWLGYPDMAAPDDDEAFAHAAHCLEPALEKATALWTTWHGDPHPDHQRAWRLARWIATRRPALRLFACPVWGRVQTPVEGAASDGLRRFATDGYKRTKAKAVAAHVSQMTRLIADDPEGFLMPPELAAHFVETDEIFIPS